MCGTRPPMLTLHSLPCQMHTTITHPPARSSREPHGSQACQACANTEGIPHQNEQARTLQRILQEAAQRRPVLTSHQVPHSAYKVVGGGRDVASLRTPDSRCLNPWKGQPRQGLPCMDRNSTNQCNSTTAAHLL